MASFRVFSSKNEIGFQALGIDREIYEVIFVCLGPLLTARRKAVTCIGIFGMTNDEDDSVFQSVLRARRERKREPYQERDEEAFAHQSVTVECVLADQDALISYQQRSSRRRSSVVWFAPRLPASRDPLH